MVESAEQTPKTRHQFVVEDENVENGAVMPFEFLEFGPSLEDIIDLEKISDDPSSPDKITTVMTYMHWANPSMYVFITDETMKDFRKKLNEEFGDGYKSRSKKILSKISIIRQILESRDENILLEGMSRIRQMFQSRDEQIRNVWRDLSDYERDIVHNMEMQELRDVRTRLYGGSFGPVLKRIETFYHIFCGSLSSKYPDIREREYKALRATFCKGK